MKRRDITLGEMQDECNKHKKCQGECPFESFCTEQRTLKDPSKWDLTDPPRFTEAQMALLKAYFDIGGTVIERQTGSHMLQVKNSMDAVIGEIMTFEMADAFRDNGDKRLFLADLFGKESNEK